MLKDVEEGKRITGEVGDAIDEFSSFLDNLAGYEDESVEELFELHFSIL